MPEDAQRSVDLIERLLTDPTLRARYRANPGQVLAEHGLSSLSEPQRALLTLELRESRSSLAGATFAAAADGLQVAEAAAHAAPGWAHAAAEEISALLHRGGARRLATPGSARGAVSSAEIPPLRPPEPTSAGASAPPAQPVADGRASQLPAPARSAAAAKAPPSARGGTSASGGTSVTGATGAPYPRSDAHDRHADAHAARAAAAQLATHAGAEHPLAYPGDDASPHQFARWMGAHAARAGLPPELPVMAALTESGLRNLSYGDRDSVGFFQMRTGIWDRGAYAGYPAHAGLQIQWFIDQALAVRAAHAGDPAFGRDPSSWGAWVADIEQPAAIYRGRYQAQLHAAQALLAGVQPHAAPAPGPTLGAGAVRVAERYLGTPYDWGGSSPRAGFDCSGLVQFAFAQVGIHLPRVAADQFHAGIAVTRGDLRLGDAVFFANPAGDVHHVGIYIGDGRFINAPATGEDVRIDSLNEPYFAAQYAGARRFAISDAGSRGHARTLPALGG